MADGLVRDRTIAEEYAPDFRGRRQNIKEDIETLKEIYESSDPDAIKAAIQRLEGSSHRIAEAMYKEALEDEK